MNHTFDIFKRLEDGNFFWRCLQTETLNRRENISTGFRPSRPATI